jgi:hypothetical protein
MLVVLLGLVQRNSLGKEVRWWCTQLCYAAVVHLVSFAGAGMQSSNIGPVNSQATYHQQNADFA